MKLNSQMADMQHVVILELRRVKPDVNFYVIADVAITKYCGWRIK